jgi:benzoate-CoA ligase
MVEFEEQMNAADYFVDRNVREGRGEHLAIVDAGNGREYSYREIAEMTNRFGNALVNALDTRIEERVMLIMLDSPALATCFFGSIKVGAVPIPTNTLLKPDDYLYLLDDSRARVLVISAPLLPQVSPILGKLSFLKHLVVVGDPATESPESQIGVHDYDILLKNASTDLEGVPRNKDDTCFWLYSSGTTGFPKGTVHLQHDMFFCSETYAKQILQIKQTDRTFSVAKLFFAYGLGNGLYFPFSVGAATILNPARPDPETVFNIIDAHKPTIFFSVPTSYAALLSVDRANERFDTASVKLCVSAGEALPPTIYTQWKEIFGVDILDGIGSTEALHIFISNGIGEVKAGSSGKVVPGYETQIVDEQGQGVAAREVGDLLISGDSACAYYWNKHEASKETIIGRWLHTGDKYSMDEDGYFYYQGRSDDMIKVSGMWVSPIEIENTLLEHEAVQQCGVVGAEDGDGLVKPKAYVVLGDGHSSAGELTEELTAFVKSRISGFKYPRWIVYLDDLP